MMCSKIIYLLLWIYSLVVVCNAYGHGFGPNFDDELYDAEESRNGTAECGTLALDRNSSYLIKGKDGLGSCTWLFLGTNECYPMITCTKFVIKASYYCLQDFLALSDGSTDVGLRFCGSHRPHYATSQTSILQATLVVNSDVGSPDFQCKVSCARHHLNYNGYGSGYNYHQPYPPTFIPTTPLKTTNCGEFIYFDCGKTGPPIKNATSSQPAGVSIQVVGGTPVDPGEYRMFAGMVQAGQSFPFCGATLLSDSCLATSGRCCTVVNGPFDVLLNVVDIQNSTGSTVRKSVKDVTVHPLFDGAFDYNVCILTLKDPVKLSGYYSGSQSEPIFQTACLPPPKTYDQYLNQNVTLVGFGDPANSNVIVKTNVTIIPNSNCTSFGPLKDNEMCAIGQDAGFCFWDAGVPLFMEVYKRYVQVGMASVLNACGSDDGPQLYTRLTEVDDWIRMTCRKSTWCKDLNTYYKYHKTYYN